MKTTKKQNKTPKIKTIPEELEETVNEMYELFQGDEFAFEKAFPEYTRGAAKRCWKKNGMGIYKPSPFNKRKPGEKYLNGERNINSQYLKKTNHVIQEKGRQLIRQIYK